ncbi:4-hydroxybenzoyl-CoA thioesterase [Streptomyces sp. Ru73]|uniref:thioesterase family protein n=1 Tax=Streptomyces sp. Ru73 TaxID=2080748 RepID=UPI000CDD9E32|nr:thioesterase family protein [Streptomyces sp. Ru73]POX40062.1 4-hydroxybenzoyl-CoA thioesterase [Streptomyces sp. Ru73]
MTAPAGALPLFRQAVKDEWIDYNGHLSEAYYVLVFGYATDALMAETGLGPEYREASGCSLYTVEAHVRYLREVDRGAGLIVRTTVLGADAKKVRFLHEMYVDAGTGEPAGDPVATEELFALHVDRATGRSAPLPGPVRDRLTALTAPAPDWAGRGIREV